ncbi:hypothetical protein VOLCADRAFT_94519 [Volvox carteri f. nagariensis]|uniref:Uncharacterized protein n=1 Tax=Volvox carteri f. nagariensis TaxID=3068 RepID=D8U503_VOLCA|nr:uncharacterized protein VOLCADRAFT_94519 [Volvox carteri f. nagariensis]EFJ45132.1 hypothetical protein VOLCADRAFT_94519 [Volvox carteri f. nagariensis]|eukprot:XP_002953808.1 hypothetical protein VOLCADRAFT_94519 [Volvox carteri f. nagariensis]
MIGNVLQDLKSRRLVFRTTCFSLTMSLRIVLGVIKAFPVHHDASAPTPPEDSWPYQSKDWIIPADLDSVSSGEARRRAASVRKVRDWDDAGGGPQGWVPPPERGGSGSSSSSSGGGRSRGEPQSAGSRGSSAPPTALTSGRHLAVESESRPGCGDGSAAADDGASGLRVGGSSMAANCSHGSGTDASVPYRSCGTGTGTLTSSSSPDTSQSADLPELRCDTDSEKLQQQQQQQRQHQSQQQEKKDKEKLECQQQQQQREGEKRGKEARGGGGSGKSQYSQVAGDILTEVLASSKAEQATTVAAAAARAGPVVVAAAAAAVAERFGAHSDPGELPPALRPSSPPYVPPPPPPLPPTIVVTRAPDVESLLAIQRQHLQRQAQALLAVPAASRGTPLRGSTSSGCAVPAATAAAGGVRSQSPTSAPFPNSVRLRSGGSGAAAEAAASPSISGATPTSPTCSLGVSSGRGGGGWDVSNSRVGPGDGPLGDHTAGLSPPLQQQVDQLRQDVARRQQQHQQQSHDQPLPPPQPQQHQLIGSGRDASPLTQPLTASAMSNGMTGNTPFAALEAAWLPISASSGGGGGGHVGRQAAAAAAATGLDQTSAFLTVQKLLLKPPPGPTGAAFAGPVEAGGGGGGGGGGDGGQWPLEAIQAARMSTLQRASRKSQERQQQQQQPQSRWSSHQIEPQSTMIAVAEATIQQQQQEQQQLILQERQKQQQLLEWQRLTGPQQPATKPPVALTHGSLAHVTMERKSQPMANPMLGGNSSGSGMPLGESDGSSAFWTAKPGERSAAAAALLQHQLTPQLHHSESTPTRRLPSQSAPPLRRSDTIRSRNSAGGASSHGSRRTSARGGGGSSSRRRESSSATRRRELQAIQERLANQPPPSALGLLSAQLLLNAGEKLVPAPRTSTGRAFFVPLKQHDVRLEMSEKTKGSAATCGIGGGGGTSTSTTTTQMVMMSSVMAPYSTGFSTGFDSLIPNSNSNSFVSTAGLQRHGAAAAGPAVAVNVLGPQKHHQQHHQQQQAGGGVSTPPLLLMGRDRRWPLG